MQDAHPPRAAYWTLRLGAAACFIGHGAFGVITKEAWLPYFAFVGIPAHWAFTLMPVVGAVDIAMGIAVLLSPRPIVLAYMVVWAAWTALLRPLTGESAFETLERAGNYGVPLALLLYTGVPRGWREWFSPSPQPDTSRNLEAVMRVLLVTTALLLFGHGALAAQGKPLLASHAAIAGVSPAALLLVGFAEMSAALLLLVSPSATLLVGIAAWKLGTEALFPIAGAPVWEFVERGGSYAAPLALALLLIAHPVRVLTLRRNP
ncbi:MAG TPA: hypothetical protein VEB19_18285 [Gemmatimonadaceae bacterium]|nr:hypothetical protein [Gemmatimonadaceae bacterium]